jgi:hypothetical protein
VHAFVHRKHIPGKSRFSAVLEKYIAPEEGGPAETERLPDAPDDAAGPATPAGDAPKEPEAVPASAPADSSSPK